MYYDVIYLSKAAYAATRELKSNRNIKSMLAILKHVYCLAGYQVVHVAQMLKLNEIAQKSYSP